MAAAAMAMAAAAAGQDPMSVAASYMSAMAAYTAQQQHHFSQQQQQQQQQHEIYEMASPHYVGYSYQPNSDYYYQPIEQPASSPIVWTPNGIQTVTSPPPSSNYGQESSTQLNCKALSESNAISHRQGKWVPIIQEQLVTVSHLKRLETGNSDEAVNNETCGYYSTVGNESNGHSSVNSTRSMMYRTFTNSNLKNGTGFKYQKSNGGSSYRNNESCNIENEFDSLYLNEEPARKEKYNYNVKRDFRKSYINKGYQNEFNQIDYEERTNHHRYQHYHHNLARNKYYKQTQDSKEEFLRHENSINDENEGDNKTWASIVSHEEHHKNQSCPVLTISVQPYKGDRYRQECGRYNYDQERRKSDANDDEIEQQMPGEFNVGIEAFPSISDCKSILIRKIFK